MENKNDTSICPNQLKPLFQSVNELPQDLNKFENDLNEIYERFYKEYRNAGQPYPGDSGSFYPPNEIDSLKLQKRYCELIRQQLSPKLAAFFYELLEKNDFFNVVFQFRLLINEKHTLLTIIQSFQSWDAVYKRQTQPKTIFNLDKALSTFSFYEDTSLALLSFEVLDILTREKIPIKRIRICRACKNIFWAKRSDSPTCGKRCLNTLNKKRTRNRQRGERYVQQYNEGIEELNDLRTKQDENHPLIQKQIAKLDQLWFTLEMLRREYVTLQTRKQ